MPPVLHAVQTIENLIRSTYMPSAGQRSPILSKESGSMSWAKHTGKTNVQQQDTQPKVPRQRNRAGKWYLLSLGLFQG